MKEADTKEIIPPDFVRKMKFYLTSPQPCPYLPGKMERKVFANLAVDGAVNLNDSLTRSGFRRSQTIAYRPACKACGACRSCGLTWRCSHVEALKRVTRDARARAGECARDPRSSAKISTTVTRAAA
jgi:arginyl-tRNA--protein-N-Asp/Glu arginylyltransferase